jgi:sugar lactone lactonase YvrE
MKPGTKLPKLALLVLSLAVILFGCGSDSTSTPPPPVVGGTIQGTPLALAGAVTTFAGAGHLDAPNACATDNTSLFVLDSGGTFVRKIVIATGESSLVAGVPGVSGSADGAGEAGLFYGASGIATDGTNLYVADTGNNTIRKVVVGTGVVTTLAGTAGSTGADDGAGATATFNTPRGIATDGTDLYIADTGNHAIRILHLADNTVTTLAGTAGVPGSADGTGTAASFTSPFALETDGAVVYVADTGNNTIRAIRLSDNVVTTLAGNAGVAGINDGTGTAAEFSSPTGLAFDGANLYIADTMNNEIRALRLSDNAVSTVAGNPTPGYADGTLADASFDYPAGVAITGGNLYVCDVNNSTLRKVVAATGVVTSFTRNPDFQADGTGAAAGIAFGNGVTTDGTNLYVADSSSNTIRKIVIATRAVTTLAGTANTSGADDGTGAAARFDSPRGITTDGTNLYVADTANNTIRKVSIATGAVTTLAGDAASPAGSADGTGAAATFSGPAGITTDGTFVYVADSGNHVIRRIVISTGVVTTFAGTAGSQGSAGGTGVAASFDNPTGITTDGRSLYVSSSGDHTVRRIVIDNAWVTTLAGTGYAADSTDGTGAAARFHEPRGLTTDGTSLYVIDTGNSTVRKIVISTGVVTTIAGTAGVPGWADGTGGNARFNGPTGITSDGVGLFVADPCNGEIRRIL